MRVDLNASVPRAVLGLLLSIPIGISIGIALAMSQRTKLMLGPLIHLLRSMPPVALLPLFVLWFGINEGAKLTATTFVCIFPIAVTTWQAAEIVDSSYRELGRDLRLGAWRYLKLVVFPGSLPSIVPGIRLAAGTSLVMVYVSELAGATAGLGYRISISQLAFQAGLMISSLIVLGIIGLLMDLALSRFFNRILHYAGK